jgi:hypothetical protein
MIIAYVWVLSSGDRAKNSDGDGDWAFLKQRAAEVDFAGGPGAGAEGEDHGVFGRPDDPLFGGRIESTEGVIHILVAAGGVDFGSAEKDGEVEVVVDEPGLDALHQESDEALATKVGMDADFGDAANVKITDG